MPTGVSASGVVNLPAESAPGDTAKVAEETSPVAASGGLATWDRSAIDEVMSAVDEPMGDAVAG